MKYGGCVHLIELSFTWLAWQNAGIIVREELYMLKSENRTVKAIKQTMDVIAFIKKFQAARKNPQWWNNRESDELYTYKNNSETLQGTLPIPGQENICKPVAETSENAAQSPVKTRSWTLVTKVSLPPLEPTFQQRGLLLSLCTPWPEQGLTPNSCSINIW